MGSPLLGRSLLLDRERLHYIAEDGIKDMQNSNRITPSSASHWVDWLLSPFLRTPIAEIFFAE